MLFSKFMCVVAYQYFNPFYCQIIADWMDVPYFVHSPVEGHVGCFPFGAVKNNAALNISMQVFVWT